MTAMADDVDDRFAGIDIDSLLNRSERRPFSYGRKKALYEAPEFIQRLNGEETVMEGQSLCIECKVRGFPAPTLRWFKDDEEILDHPRIHVESSGTGSYSLIIDSVNRGDEAAYRCRAENLEGQCSSFFFLSVRSKPKSPKKKNSGSSPGRRTVSFPPMFATIVEKVEEEEKQGKEQELLPPSPMTEFYYALTLKGRQSFPEFVGDWAFANGGHSRKRRNSTGSISSQNYESSSDDEVFSDEEDNRGPPAKKPLFYLVEDGPAISDSDASPTDGMMVYNSNVIPTSSVHGHGTKGVDLENKQNNNASLGATSEVLDNRGSHSKQDTGKVDNRAASGSVQASRNVQGDINDNKKGSKPLARVIKGQAPTTKGNNATQSTATKEEKESAQTDTGNKRQHTPGGSPQKGQFSGQPAASNMNVRCVNVIAPTPDSKGDITPPIVVEMWEEPDASAKMPKQTGYSLNPQQASPGSSAKKLSTTGYSREEREPTPFFKGSNSKGKGNENQHSHLLGAHGPNEASTAADGSRIEREPTPFYDDKTKQQQHQQQHVTGLGRSALEVPGANSSKEGQDFQRESTPFYDHKKDTTKNVSLGNSLGVPGAAGQNVRSPRESTPFYKDENSNRQNQNDGGSSLAPPSSSLAVPTGEGVRDARESTPYYNETDPYEYIHHPDHHFSEKKAVLVKQSSAEDEHDPTHTKEKLLAATASSPSPSTAPPLPAKPPPSRHPQTLHKPPQNLSLRMPKSSSPSGDSVSPTSDSTAETEQFTDSYQRRLRSCRQTPPPEVREISGNTLPSKVATLQSPVKACQSVINLIRGKSVTIEKNDPASPSKSKNNSAANTTGNDTITLQAKPQNVYTSNVPDASSEKQAVGTRDKKVEISKSTSTTKESSKVLTVSVSKKTTQDKSTVSSSSLQTSTTVGGSASTITSKSSHQATTKLSSEHTKTASETQKQSFVSPTTQTKISTPSLAQANTQVKTMSQSIVQVQTSSVSTSQLKVTSVTTASRTTGIPLPTNSKGPLAQKTAPLAVQESLVVERTKSVNTASTATTKEQISEQISSQTLPVPPSAIPKTRTRTRGRTKSPEISSNTNMTTDTNSYDQVGATGEDTLLLNSDSNPKKSLFSNTFHTRHETRMASTPPADTAWKKKESKASGFSGALSSFLRPRRGKDDGKEETTVKEKSKRGKSSPDGGKSKSKRDQAPVESRTARELTRSISIQDLARYSPFGRHTTEGFCFLFIMAVVCLYLDMPIEKFVCYVLAAFYTFCVLRILGLVE